MKKLGRWEERLVAQNRWILITIILGFVLLIAVVVFASSSLMRQQTDIQASILSLNYSIKGLSNNEAFSQIAHNMEQSVYMITTRPGPTPNGHDMAEVYVDDKGDVWGKGTGFAVSANGHILTAAHVVQGAEEVRIMLFDTTTGEPRPIPAAVLGINPPYDLALLKVDIPTTPVNLYRGDSIIPTGTKIGFIGYPFAEPMQAVHDGIISGITLRQTDGGTLPEYRIHAFVNAGQSGGPLFLADTGEVIGYISARQKASNLPLANYDQTTETEDLNTRLLIEIYNILSSEMGRTSQMGVGVAIGINSLVVEQMTSTTP